VFNDTTEIEVWTEVSNTGELHVNGSLKVSLMDMDMEEKALRMFDLTLRPGEEVNLSTSFSMTGLSGDIYIVMGRLTYDGGSSSRNHMMVREGPPSPPLPAIEIALGPISNDVLEGGTLNVSGTIVWSNGTAVNDISVSMWLDDGRPASRARTGSDGSFGLGLGNLSAGNWTLTIFAYGGDRKGVEHRSLSVTPEEVPSDDENVTDDDVPPDDDGNITDDDDEGGTPLGWVLVLSSCLFVLLVLVAVVAITVLVAGRRSRSRELEE
jgi:hypothetical protein